MNSNYFYIINHYKSSIILPQLCSTYLFIEFQKGRGRGAEFDVNLRWLNIHLSLADATKKGRGPRDAVPVHETEGNTRGHPGCLSRVSDIDTQCCDPSRYLVR